jgi:hypothetical protein
MPRVRKQENPVGVEDALRALGVDEDLPPDAAALDHAARISVPIGGPGDEDDEDDSDDDDFDDDDEGEEEDRAASPAPKRSPLPDVVPIKSKTPSRVAAAMAGSPTSRGPRSTKFPAVAPEPAARGPRAAKPMAPEAELEPEPLPFIAPPPPPAMRPKAKQKGPGLSRLGATLASKVPGAEQLKVYLRKDTGQLGFIGTYQANDLRRCTDIEEFAFRYLKPKYGAGEYVIHGIDAHGRELDVGSVHLLDPPAMSEAQGALGLVQQMISKQEKWLEDRERSLKPSSSSGLEAVTMLREVMNVAEMASKDAKEEKAKVAAEAASSSNAMMQMFMAMQQQNQQMQLQMQQQTMQLISAMAQPREDPLMKMLLAKLVEEKSSSGGLPPPPPPPPPADPVDGLAKLLAAIVPLMQPGGGGGGDDEYKSMLKEMVAARENERMTPKDILQMMQEMRQERGTDDFKKSADNLAMMLSLTNQLRQSTEGGAAAGFWDALGALFGNRDFAGSIAQSIRAKASTEQQTQLTQQQQAQMLQRQALVLAQQQEAQRRVLEARAQQALKESTTPPAATVPPATPVPIPAPAPSPTPLPAARENVVPIRKPVEEAKTPPTPIPGPSKPTIQLPPLPANAIDHLNQIILAPDEAGMIEHLIKLVMYLSEFPDWKPFTTEVLKAAQAGNKRETLQFLATAFEGLMAMGLIDRPLAQKVLLAVNKHFADIHKNMGLDGSEDEAAEEPGEFDFLDEDDDDED